MKILYLQVFPLYGSGSGTYARELALQMAKKHQIALLSPDKRKLPGITMYEVKNAPHISFTGHPDWPEGKVYTKVSGHELSANYLVYFKAIMNAIEDFQPNIIHVHHLMPLTWIARFVKIAYGLNFIVTAHGSELPTLEKDKRYPYLTAEALHKAVRIGANSFWTKDWMQKVFGNAFNSKIRVIPGGVDPSVFPARMDTSEMDEKYKLSGKKLILFSGKLTAYKGVRYLITAAKKIDGVIGIAGDGPQRTYLEDLTKEFGLTNVRFFGLVKNHDLIKLYYRADVCIVPSVWDEPLGLVVLEAMAAKTPVVVTRKGGVTVMLKENYNGLLIRPRNPADIVEKVNLLLANDALRKKMGERARETVLERFTWAKIAHRYEDMYREFGKKVQI